jgi:hypothetical protein
VHQGQLVPGVCVDAVPVRQLRRTGHALIVELPVITGHPPEADWLGLRGSRPPGSPPGSVSAPRPRLCRSPGHPQQHPRLERRCPSAQPEG